MALPKGAEIVIFAHESEDLKPYLSTIKDLGFKPNVVTPSTLAIYKAPEKLHGLLVLAPLNKACSEEFLLNSFTVAQKSYEGLLEAASESDAFFVTVTNNGGKFSLQGDFNSMDAWSGGLSGLSKTASHEWPEISCKAIDLGEFSTSKRRAEKLLTHCLLQGLSEVGLTEASMHIIDMKKSWISESLVDKAALSASDVVIVTGGARGVTADVACALARRFHSTFILLGRSPKPQPEPSWLQGVMIEAEIKSLIIKNASKKLKPKDLEKAYKAIQAGRQMNETFERITNAGAKYKYYPVDVRSEESVRNVLKQVEKEVGAVTGVVHGAGVLMDRLIKDKTIDQFRSVFGTKVIGYTNIMNALDKSKLKALVMFSSSTARFGRKGQVDYAVANEVLNKSGQLFQKNHPSCKVVSVNWGPWDGGMVTPGLKKLFKEEGITVIPLDSGAEYLADELSKEPSNEVEVVILGAQSQITSQYAQVARDTPIVSFEVDVNSHPYLMDHVLNGKAVVPAAMMIEWLTFAAMKATSDLNFIGFDNFKVLKGITLSADEHVSLDVICLSLESKGPEQRSKVQLMSQNRKGQKFIHAEAEVIFNKSTPKAPNITLTTKPQAMQTSVKDAYKNYLFHGESFQGIKAIEGCDTSGISAQVVTAKPPGKWSSKLPMEYWNTDPLVLDGAFQMMIVWSSEKVKMPCLPTHVSFYRQYKDFGQGPVSIHVGHIDNSHSHEVSSTLEFLNAENELVAVMKDYRGVMDASLNKVFKQNKISSFKEGRVNG